MKKNLAGWLLLLLLSLSLTFKAFGQNSKTINISNEFTSGVAGTPRVVQDPTRDFWVVTWRQGNAIKGRVVKEDGTMTAAKNLATGANSAEQCFDIALDTHEDASHLLAFENSAGLQVRSLPSLKPGAMHLIEAGARGSMPRLVFDSASEGRYLIFWLGSQDGTRSALRVRQLSEDGDPLGAAVTLASAAAGQTFGALNVSPRPNGSMTAILFQQSTSGGSVIKVNITSNGQLQGPPQPFQKFTNGLNTIGDIDFSAQGIGFGLWIDKDSVRRRKVTASGGFGGAIKSISNVASVDEDTIQAGISFNAAANQFVGVWTNEDQIFLVNLNGTTGTPVKSPASIATSTLGFSRNANVASDTEGKSLVVWEDSSFDANTTGMAKFKIRGGLITSGGGGDGGSANVSIGDNFFQPKSITIKLGTEITWTNQGHNVHTVTEGAPGDPEGSMIFDGHNIGPGQTFKFKFTEKGTFNYFCEIHGSSMSGTVIVSE
jgi:plastocyanin